MTNPTPTVIAPASPNPRRRNAWLCGLSVVALFIGTLLPGPWRDAVESRLFPPALGFSSWAHFALFAFILFFMRARPLAVRPWPALGLALGLALLTEGLQHFVLGRHPRLRDVGIDLCGALLGLVCASVLARPEQSP